MESISCQKCGKPMFLDKESGEYEHSFKKDSPGYCFAGVWERTPKKLWTPKMRMYHNEAAMTAILIMGAYILAVFGLAWGLLTLADIIRWVKACCGG